MFDFGSGELLVIGVVALVVIGPKELPGVLRTVGKTVARLRRMAGDFQGQFQDAMREADLHDAVKSISDIQTSVSSATNFYDPLAGLPTPTLPEPAVAPPVELQAPPKPEAAAVPAAEEKPKRTRAKKAKAEDATPPHEETQAALFDTLDTMAKKAETPVSAEPAEPKVKKPRAVKAKAEPSEGEADALQAKPTKRKAKPKDDEASS